MDQVLDFFENNDARRALIWSKYRQDYSFNSEYRSYLELLDWQTLYSRPVRGVLKSFKEKREALLKNTEAALKRESTYRQAWDKCMRYVSFFPMV